MAHLLLVEDDEFIGSVTVAGLESRHAVDWFKSAEDASVALRREKYDLMILDINLPQKSGMDLLRDLRSKNDNSPALFLTGKNTIESRVEGLNAGADDYLVKPFEIEELLVRVDVLLRRCQVRQNNMLKIGDVVYDLVAHHVQKSGEDVVLSTKEATILEILMNNPDRYISRPQIEQHLYHMSGEILESNAVEVHISALRRKLGKDFIRTSRGIGYCIPLEQ